MRVIIPDNKFRSIINLKLKAFHNEKKFERIFIESKFKQSTLEGNKMHINWNLRKGKYRKAMQRKKATKYHKYDFRQRNFPCHERRRIETLNKGVYDANLCTYKMRKAFSFCFVLFVEEKEENLFIQFLSYFHMLFIRSFHSFFAVLTEILMTMS